MFSRVLAASVLVVFVGAGCAAQQHSHDQSGMSQADMDRIEAAVKRAEDAAKRAEVAAEKAEVIFHKSMQK